MLVTRIEYVELPPANTTRTTGNYGSGPPLQYGWLRPPQPRSTGLPCALVGCGLCTVSKGPHRGRVSGASGPVLGFWGGCGFLGRSGPVWAGLGRFGPVLGSGVVVGFWAGLLIKRR